jgi:hypothetical protein
MDGVLADFDRGYRERFSRVSDKQLDNVDWALVRETPHFYRDLPPMPDMLELWHGVCHLNPIVLTGVPISVDEAASNKREWVDKHLGHDVHMIACLSKDKRLHGKPGDILVDDWEKHKHAWIDMGGVWITHTSAAATLALLTALTQEHSDHVHP